MTLLGKTRFYKQHERAVHCGVTDLRIDLAGFLPGLFNTDVLVTVFAEHLKDDLTLFGGFELVMYEIFVEFFNKGFFFHIVVLVKPARLVNASVEESFEIAP